MDFSALMREKRETFAINIRKQKREEVFRLKRFIDNNDLTNFDSIYKDSLQSDPQRLNNVLVNTINDIHQLYGQMPTTTHLIISRVRKIRNLLKIDPRKVTKVILEMDLIRTLAALLKPEYEILMEEAGWTLCAFMVQYDHTDFDFWNEYNIQLKPIQRQYVKDIKYLLTVQHRKMALNILGNMILDWEITFDEFLKEGGLGILLALYNQETQLVLWILNAAFQNRTQYLDQAQVGTLLPFLNESMTKPTEDLLKVMEAISSEKGMNMAQQVASQSNFKYLIDELNGSHQQLVITILTHCCWTEELHQLALNTKLIIILELLLNSFSVQLKEDIFFIFENLVLNEHLLRFIMNRKDILLKCTHSDNSFSLTKQCVQFILSCWEQDQEFRYLPNFIEYGLIQFVSHLLNYQNQTIVQHGVKLVVLLLEIHHHDQEGLNILQQMKISGIFQKILNIQSSHYLMKAAQSDMDKIFNFFDNKRQQHS